MKRTLLVYFLLAYLAIPSLHAHCGTVEISGQALYWRPGFGGVRFAALVQENLNSEVLFIDQTSDWGYELEGKYTVGNGCAFGAIRFAYFRSAESTLFQAQEDEVILPLFAIVPLPVESAAASIRSRYWHIDGEGGIAFVLNRCLQGHLLAGVRTVDIDEHEHFIYGEGAILGLIDLGSAIQDHCTQGIGPRIGLRAEWAPFAYADCCWLRGLQVGGHIGVSALFGTRKLFVRIPALDLITDQQVRSYPTRSTTFPGIDTKGWVSYALNFWCVRVAGEFGYELNTYLNARDRLDGINFPGFVSPRELTSASFGGLYFGARIGVQF